MHHLSKYNLFTLRYIPHSCYRPGCNPSFNRETVHCTVLGHWCSQTITSGALSVSATASWSHPPHTPFCKRDGGRPCAHHVKKKTEISVPAPVYNNILLKCCSIALLTTENRNLLYSPKRAHARAITRIAWTPAPFTRYLPNINIQT